MSGFQNTSTGAALQAFIVENARQMAFYVAVIHYIRDYWPFYSTNDLQQ
jgi:hypothetical protein